LHLLKFNKNIKFQNIVSDKKLNMQSFLKNSHIEYSIVWQYYADIVIGDLGDCSMDVVYIYLLSFDIAWRFQNNVLETTVFKIMAFFKQHTEFSGVSTRM